MTNNIRYEYVRKKIDEFIDKYKINKLPVNPMEIIQSRKITIRTYEFYAQKHRLTIKDIIDIYGSEDAFTVCENGIYSIAYNDKIRSAGRKRFTLMHEIGHIYLKHLEEFDETIMSRGGLNTYKYKMLESEANMFASEVLSPYPVLVLLNWTNYRTLINNCGLSVAAAKTRASQIFDLIINNVYIDKQSPIIKNFYGFVYKKYCSNCSHELISETAKYCPICGNKLKWGNGNMIYDDGFELDENGKAKICPRCGNEQVPKEGEYCDICGAYLINKCSNDKGDINTEPCGEIASGNARYCKYCGAETTFYQWKFLKDWQEVKTEETQQESKSEAALTTELDDVPF